MPSQPNWVSELRLGLNEGRQFELNYIANHYEQASGCNLPSVLRLSNLGRKPRALGFDHIGFNEPSATWRKRTQKIMRGGFMATNVPTNEPRWLWQRNALPSLTKVDLRAQEGAIKLSVPAFSALFIGFVKKQKRWNQRPALTRNTDVEPLPQ